MSVPSLHDIYYLKLMYIRKTASTTCGIDSTNSKIELVGSRVIIKESTP